jgi:hypothetical protein
VSSGIPRASGMSGDPCLVLACASTIGSIWIKPSVITRRKTKKCTIKSSMMTSALCDVATTATADDGDTWEDLVSTSNPSPNLGYLLCAPLSRVSAVNVSFWLTRSRATVF